MTEESNDSTFLVVGDQTFANEEAVVTKLSHQDSHISKVEAENADMRKKLDVYMEAAANSAKGTTEKVTPDATAAEPTAGLGAEEVARIVKEQIETMSAQSQYQANSQTIESTLAQELGSEEAAKTALEAKATELGVSKEVLETLKQQSPKAVLGWFGKTPQAPITSTTPNRNSAAIGTGQPAEGSWEYWKQLRKTNSDDYFSPATTMRRMKDAERLGDKFF